MKEFSPRQQKQINQASQVLQPDEVIIDATKGIIRVTRMGQRTSRNGTILVTDRRVILFTKKLGGYEMNDHVYGLLTALDYKKGIIYGNLTLAASGDRTHISQIPKEDIERLVKNIRDRMAVASHASRQAAHAPQSMSDEIQKLAALRDQGILTDEEFTAKKRQMLGI